MSTGSLVVPESRMDNHSFTRDFSHRNFCRSNGDCQRDRRNTASDGNYVQHFPHHQRTTLNTSGQYSEYTRVQFTTGNNCKSLENWTLPPDSSIDPVMDQNRRIFPETDEGEPTNEPWTLVERNTGEYSHCFGTSNCVSSSGGTVEKKTFSWVAPQTPIGAVMKDQSPDRRAKRQRTSFSATQLLGLERQFRVGPYLTHARRIAVAADLELDERQIKIWYADRRRTLKLHTPISNTSFTIKGYQYCIKILYYITLYYIIHVQST